MIKTRKTIPQKTKMLLQKEIMSTCPFCNNNETEHFEIHHIDGDTENNSVQNLLMLCRICHSKINIDEITRDEVYKKKIALANGNKDTATKPNSVNFNSKVNNAFVGNIENLKIDQRTKTVKQKYPEGCIGSDHYKNLYISHLITRYHDYLALDIGKDKVNYATFPSTLKKRYKIGATRTIYNLPVEKFEELAEYIQKRIDGTKFAQTQGKSHKNYSTFEEHKEFLQTKKVSSNSRI